ncbi:hypothetical protein GW17_00009394 [Ensete ventricosum]|nr:hypothetical protein GW17_00009394 [Ensete ventricosum]
MAAGAAELFNGERAVVLLFVSRVLFSVPLSLFYEALALFLLVAGGLVVEISAEGSTVPHRFKTRSALFPCHFKSLNVLPGIHTKLCNDHLIWIPNFYRPGASSGILLGTATLPAAMLSRLIQLSRVLLENDANSEGRVSHL